MSDRIYAQVDLIKTVFRVVVRICVIPWHLLHFPGIKPSLFSSGSASCEIERKDAVPFSIF